MLCWNIAPCTDRAWVWRIATSDDVLGPKFGLSALETRSVRPSCWCHSSWTSAWFYLAGGNT